MMMDACTHVYMYACMHVCMCKHTYTTLHYISLHYITLRYVTVCTYDTYVHARIHTHISYSEYIYIYIERETDIYI